MTRPPADRPARTGLQEPTWQRIAVSYAMAAAIPVALWFVSRPLLGVAVLTVLATSRIAVPWARSAAQCVRECREIAVDLGNVVRITVEEPPADDCC
jgi:Flp pilus assembly protein TadB